MDDIEAELKKFEIKDPEPDVQPTKGKVNNSSWNVLFTNVTVLLYNMINYLLYSN